MESDPRACRLCGDPHIRCLGSIPDSDFFAGRVLRWPIYGAYLWHCDACESMFRHPVMPTSTYFHLYAAGSADEWVADEGRQDLAIIRRVIAEQPKCSSVLDVGCGGGEFLSSLPKDVKKYGVEPSVAAATAAKERGVSIVAQTLDGLSPSEHFDVITMIDVIEHIANPSELLDAALAHLNVGGSLIVATGDPGYLLWRRLFRSKFWYSSFPEHISFPSEKFFGLWQRANGLQVPAVLHLKYRRIPLQKAVLHFATQIVYLGSPALLNRMGCGLQWLRRAPHPRRRTFSPGAPGVYTDHQVVTIRRLS
jgi:SAM-dependent methyltransferase